MTAFTSGAWHAEIFDEADNTWGVYADDAPRGLKLPAICHGKNAEGNAHLMAAAPTMLAAAERALVLLDAYNGMTLPIGVGEEVREVADALRLAIVQARNESVNEDARQD